MRNRFKYSVGGRAVKSIISAAGSDLDELYSWSDKLQDWLCPQMDGRHHDALSVTRYIVTVDQQRRTRTGDIRRTFAAAFGNAQVASIYTASNDCKRSDPESRAALSDLHRQYRQYICDRGRWKIRADERAGDDHVAALPPCPSTTRANCRGHAVLQPDRRLAWRSGNAHRQVPVASACPAPSPAVSGHAEARIRQKARAHCCCSPSSSSTYPRHAV